MRYVGVDALRGVAILVVVAFHATWDLGAEGLIDLRISRTSWGAVIAHTTASVFLLLVGVSAVLAHRDGVRWRPFLARLARLVALAVVISVVTAVLYPRAPVTFGILHAIALTSLLVLPFLRAPVPVTLLAAAVATALPWLVTIPGASRWWAWTGLTAGRPPSVDSAPLLPFLGASLLGVALARLVVGSRVEPAVAAWGSDSRTVRALARLGRHTLSVYVLHQPVLVALIRLVRLVT